MNIKSTHEIHKFFALVVSFLFFTALPSIVSAQTAQEIARKAFLSTVLLVMEDANCHSLSLDSGFLIREGEKTSNLHVVEGAFRGCAKAELI